MNPEIEQIFLVLISFLLGILYGEMRVLYKLFESIFYEKTKEN